MLMNLIYELLNGKINPAIEIIDAGKISIFDQELVKRTKGDVSRILNELNMVKLTSPKEALRRITMKRLKERGII